MGTARIRVLTERSPLRGNPGPNGFLKYPLLPCPYSPSDKSLPDFRKHYPLPILECIMLFIGLSSCPKPNHSLWSNIAHCHPNHQPSKFGGHLQPGKSVTLRAYRGVWEGIMKQHSLWHHWAPPHSSFNQNPLD